MADWRYVDRFPDRYDDRSRGVPPGPLPQAKRRREYEYGGPAGDRDGPPGPAYGGGGLNGRDRGSMSVGGAMYDDRGPTRSAGSWRDGPDAGMRGRDHMGPPTMVPGPMVLGGPDDHPMVPGGARAAGGGMDLLMVPRGGGPLPPLAAGSGGDLPPVGDPPLPTDAAPTLYIDNLPDDCTRREASHIFRPFIGFKEVRLVHKEVRRGTSSEKVVLCFVDFADARCAATALEALQGYRFDESDYSSPNLRIDFARQGPRHGFGTSRGEDRRGDDREYRSGPPYRGGPRR